MKANVLERGPEAFAVHSRLQQAAPANNAAE
jgi:hypothetical protein